MRHATFRQLEIFSTVAQAGSFSRAAEQLHLTQPTVSMQMKKLAAIAGLPLFDQVGKQLIISEAGRALLAASREVFDAVERFQMTVADLKGLKQGRLRIAVLSTAQYFAPALLSQFCRRYPGIEVALEIGNRAGLLARLRDVEDDLYILGQPPVGLDVTAIPFLGNRLVPIAAAAHPLAAARGTSLARFAEEPFIARESGSGTRLAVERLFEQHRVALRVRMVVGSNEAIKRSVAAGLGVSILSRHTLLGSAEGLTILDVDDLPIERRWYVVFPRSRQLSLVAGAFLDYLQDEGREVANRL